MQADEAHTLPGAPSRSFSSYQECCHDERNAINFSLSSIYIYFPVLAASTRFVLFVQLLDRETKVESYAVFIVNHRNNINNVNRLQDNDYVG